MNGEPVLVKQYVKEKLLGSGQFGHVYRVHDKDNEKKIYALKMIKFDDDDRMKQYIETEIESMKKVECDNSVKLIESFKYDTDYQSYICLVLELCDDSLENIYKIRKKNKKIYNELEVYMILSQLNNCLRKMREGDEIIIHRDLKLDNILIKYDPRIPIIGFSVKLSDFGLSKKMKDNDTTSTQLGTPLTKAPEIWFELGHNAKADLWSIGIIMFQLLFNRNPFVARSIGELKNWIRNFKKIEWSEEMRKNISNECIDLLNNLLIKDPNTRIDFDKYFEHKFFSEEHKNELMKKFYFPQKNKTIKKISLKLKEFENQYKKLMLLKEYDSFKLYKGKDLNSNKIVYIKEIMKDVIDKNKEYCNKFNKEIELLFILKGLNYPKCYGLFITEKYYFIIMEYCTGKILEDFIAKRKGILKESLKESIINQLQSSSIQLKKYKISLENISSKSLIFSYYQNENNFVIKIFDYFLNSIFCQKDDNSTIFKSDDFKKDSSKKIDNYIQNENNIPIGIEPIIKDEDLENVLNIIKNKIEFVINYFKEFFDEKNILEIEIFSNFIKEIIILLYFCLLECRIIINFLNTNADKNVDEIDKSAQEIHILKIYLSEDNKYEYSNINFLEHLTIWYYNKENPTFDIFLNSFHKMKNQLESILNEYIKKNLAIFSFVHNSKDKEEEVWIDFELEKKIVENCIKEGNLENLFSKFFENTISLYPIKKKNIIEHELHLVKYIMEYIIFIKLILQDDNNNITKFEKIFKNLNDSITFATFIGYKIKNYDEKKILNHKIYNDEDENTENILLKKMINFYTKINKYNSK